MEELGERAERNAPAALAGLLTLLRKREDRVVKEFSERAQQQRELYSQENALREQRVQEEFRELRYEESDLLTLERLLLRSSALRTECCVSA